MRVEDLAAYEVIERKENTDINSVTYLCRHKKTGARVVLISNDDDNKVFYIGFRTPPTDSTGVAHILEHSVLCGSEKFPIKDPFVELAKGSLNTFLNAMTYPDKTVYPVASCNDKDFQNLMHVYLDAVFYPNIYRKPEIFRQEGWHYELDEATGNLSVNGVVYNEMKGVYSSPDDMLESEIMRSLYPDTTYGLESGGDPDVIPELDYEEFLDFHRRYYHPSNSYIYLYGDMDMAEKLTFIDEQYLSAFDALEIDSSIADQAAFEVPVRTVKEYPISEEEDEVENTFLAWNFVVGHNLDKEYDLAFQIIDYALCSAPGAPLKQALIDKGLGKDVYSISEFGIKQPFYSIVAKDIAMEREEEFKATVVEVLEKIVREGFNKKALLAGLNAGEFAYREADFGSYGKGLMYGLSLLESWLYDESKPFIHIEANAVFEALRQKIDTGYFERLVEQYLLQNQHCSIVVLKPSKTFAAEREALWTEQMEKAMASMTEEDRARVLREKEELTAFQEHKDSKEDLAKMPLLERADMKKEAAPFVMEECKIDDTVFLYHDLFTNGVGYLKLIFKLDNVPGSYYPYITLLAKCLTQLNTEHYGYADLANEINLAAGGLRAAKNVYTSIESTDDFLTTFEIRTKFLYPNLKRVMELIKEIVLTADMTDTKRHYELMAEGKSRLQADMISAGHSMAVGRALSYGSKAMAATEEMSGVPFYRFLCEVLADFEGRKEDLVAKLQELFRMIFRKENLLVDFVGESKVLDELGEEVRSFKEVLYTEPVAQGSFDAQPKRLNEGYMTSGQVQYVCRAGNFRKKGLPYKGTLQLLKVMMGYEYLWENVRVKGGAYGCMCNFSRRGDCYFVSYRDPNLAKTVEVYEKAAEAVAAFDADERTMTQYIIGTMGELDAPLTPSSKGAVALSAYLTGVTYEMVQQARDEILSATVEDIRALSAYIEAFMEQEQFCVVGNGTKIKEAEKLFMNIENLL